MPETVTARERALSALNACWTFVAAGAERHGWTVTDGKSGGGAGYSTNAANGRRERLWMSPACIPLAQPGLFDEASA